MGFDESIEGNWEMLGLMIVQMRLLKAAKGACPTERYERRGRNGGVKRTVPYVGCGINDTHVYRGRTRRNLEIWCSCHSYLNIDQLTTWKKRNERKLERIGFLVSSGISELRDSFKKRISGNCYSTRHLAVGRGNVELL